MSNTCKRCGQPLESGDSDCPGCGLAATPTLTCDACGAGVRKDDDYCWSCGLPLDHPLHCWRCGRTVFRHSSFCSSCGSPQPDLAALLRQAAAQEHSGLPHADRRRPAAATDMDSPPRIGRRAAPSAQTASAALATETDRLKIVTVMFADVSGFTRMSEALSPEEVKDVMEECFRGLSAEITDRGGTIDKFIGDCVMALFGAPTAREDDAERALDAALAMQAFLQEFSERMELRLGHRLAMRIGINTGKVLAGFIGSGERRDFTVMGDAVNVASRLEHACPVGSILASYDTHHLARGQFIVRHLEPLQVKGKKEPLRVVEVLGRRPPGVDIVDPTFFGVPTKMIGRRQEMERLRAGLVRVRESATPVVATLRSEIGMGKSRLLLEFAGHLLRERTCELDVVRCRDYRTESTFAPLLALFDRLMDLRSDDDPVVLRGKVRAFLSRLGQPDGERERTEGALAHLLGVPLTDLPSLTPLAGEPERLESAVREAVLTFFRLRSRVAPIALAVEDLHAASPPFLDLLSTLTSLPDLPLLLLGSYRPEADAAVEQRFAHHPDRIHFELQPLTAPEAADMVDDLLQRVVDVPEALVRRVLDVCQGRPLFIEETLGELVERGIISAGQEEWTIDAPRVREVVLPQSVEAAILSRVDALPGPSRQALQIAAVTGDVCWQGLVQDIGTLAPTALDELEARRLIERLDRSQLSSEQEFRIPLPAVRETVEHHVLRKVRIRLHGQIARWLDARLSGEHEYFDRLLGHHYALAEEPEASLPYRLRAGRKAEERGDTARALEDLQWAWEHSRALAPTGVPDPVALAETRISVARLLRRLGRVEEAEPALEDSLSFFAPLCDGQPEIDRALRRMGIQTAHSLIQAGRTERARELLAAATAGLETAGDPAAVRLRAWALKWEGWIRFLEKDHEGALEAYHQGIAMLEPLGATDELGSLLDGLGACLSKMRRYAEAEQTLKRAIDTYRATFNREGEAGSLGNIGVLLGRQLLSAPSIQAIEESRILSEASGNLVIAAICRANKGEVLRNDGNTEAAASEYEAALKVFSRTKSRNYQLATLDSLIQCYMETGEREKADKLRGEILSLKSS